MERVKNLLDRSGVDDLGLDHISNVFCLLKERLPLPLSLPRATPFLEVNVVVIGVDFISMVEFKSGEQKEEGEFNTSFITISIFLPCLENRSFTIIGLANGTIERT